MNCCAISNDDGDASECLDSGVRRGRKNHRCGECYEAIPKGTLHEFYKLAYDGRVSTERTCLVCAEIRTHFSCDGSWIFGQVWESLAESLFPSMTAGGECLTGLSPAAKAKLFEACLEHILDEGRRDKFTRLRSVPPSERFEPGVWMHPELVLERQREERGESPTRPEIEWSDGWNR